MSRTYLFPVLVTTVLIFQHALGDDPCRQGSVCPLGFLYNPNVGSCYNLVTSEKISWYDAVSVCAGMNSNLAAIESQEEYDFLRTEIKGRGFVGSGATNGDSFHLGGNLLNGAWQWIGGPSWKTKPMSYAPWGTGQPNLLSTQLCTLLWGGEDFKFHNWDCPLKFHYICEIKIK